MFRRRKIKNKLRKVTIFFYLAQMGMWGYLFNIANTSERQIVTLSVLIMVLIAYALLTIPRKITEIKHSYPKWYIPLENKQCASYNRIGKLRLNGGQHTKEEWEQVKRKQNYCCARCKRHVTLTRDHIIPVYVGGTDNISNIQGLCKACNSVKGTRTIDYRGK